jgi:hypothetical protein
MRISISNRVSVGFETFLTSGKNARGILCKISEEIAERPSMVKDIAIVAARQ